MTSPMREKEEGVAELPEVEPDVFIALYEFASTDDYSVPPPDPNDEYRYLRAILKECKDSFGELCGQEHEQAVESVTLDTEKDSPQCLDERQYLPSDLALEPGAPEEAPPFEEVPQSNWDLGYSLNRKQSKKACRTCGCHKKVQVDISQTTKLWQQFQEQQFPRSHSKLTYPSSRPNIMFHAKLYCLAEEKMIEPLKECCLRHMHKDLLRFESGNNTIQEVLNLASFAYTMRSRQSFKGDDGLRKLVSHYIASQGQTFRASKYFRAVLDAYGELSSDLVYLLLH